MSSNFMKARDWFRFGHVAIWGYTALLPLIGAGTAKGTASGWLLFGLLATAVSFHLYAYLLNDLIDLSLDKTQRSREHYPLVSGKVSERQTFIWVVIQVPMMFGFWYVIAGDLASLFCLVWAILGMTIYNIWGKRSPLPPLTDWVQGTSWAAFLLFGAFVVDKPTAQTFLAGGFIIIYILLVNGINGSLRDLANDYTFGARTTAIWLGARPLSSGLTIAPARLRAYAFFWQATLVLLAWLIMNEDVASWRINEASMFWLRNGFVIVTSGCCLILWQTTAPAVIFRKTEPLLMGHNILMLLLLFTAVLPFTNNLTRWTIMLAFSLPLLTADWLLDRLSRLKN